MSAGETKGIGQWTEDKLNILREYLHPYSLILSKNKFSGIYIDAFSGSGSHALKGSGEIVQGSPLNAINIEPPFTEYFFVEMDLEKFEVLESKVRDRKDVRLFFGDCNKILVSKIFPLVQYRDRKRALCFLDPYGIHLHWNVIEAAAKTQTIEIFINFSIMDINRNIKMKKFEDIGASNVERMTDFWGDDSWIEFFFDTKLSLFGDLPEKKRNDEIAQAYRKRLMQKAGYEYVPDPLPMYLPNKTVLYYLFFASHNKTGAKIARDIFQKYKNDLE